MLLFFHRTRLSLVTADHNKAYHDLSWKGSVPLWDTVFSAWHLPPHAPSLLPVSSSHSQLSLLSSIQISKERENKFSPCCVLSAPSWEPMHLDSQKPFSDTSLHKTWWQFYMSAWCLNKQPRHFHSTFPSQSQRQSYLGWTLEHFCNMDSRAKAWFSLFSTNLFIYLFYWMQKEYQFTKYCWINSSHVRSL